MYKHRQRIKHGSIIGVVLFSLLFFVSCKTRVSLSGASIPIEAKTTSVAFFTNNASLAPPSLPQVFTEKLQQRRKFKFKRIGFDTRN